MHELVNADLFPVVSLSLAKMTTGCRHTHTFIVFRPNSHEFFFLLIYIISLTVYGMKEQTIHLTWFQENLLVALIVKWFLGITL